ncbi:hypothetical protein D3C80_1401210 [compost metagenome]
MNTMSTSVLCSKLSFINPRSPLYTVIPRFRESTSAFLIASLLAETMVTPVYASIPSITYLVVWLAMKYVSIAYSAVSVFINKAAMIKIRMFIPSMISVIEKLLFLKVNSASTSIPSKVPPPRIERPIPTPRKKPPNIATSNLSCVSSGKFTNCSVNAISAIVRPLRIAKCLPTR